MKHLNKFVGAALAATCAMIVTPVMAEAELFNSNNSISLLQDGNGNKFISNQSNASNSKIAGGSLDEILTDGILDSGKVNGIQSPVEQLGKGNFAKITISDDGGYVFLFQNNDTVSIVGNDATITVIGENSFASVSQDGSNNEATITVNGAFSGGSILQEGDDNESTVTLNTVGLDGTNTGSTATLAIVGNNNKDFVLEVSAPDGVDVVYTFTGSGVQSPSPIIVNSIVGGASISITQTNNN